MLSSLVAPTSTMITKGPLPSPQLCQIELKSMACPFAKGLWTPLTYHPDLHLILDASYRTCVDVVLHLKQTFVIVPTQPSLLPLPNHLTPELMRELPKEHEEATAWSVCMSEDSLNYYFFPKWRGVLPYDLMVTDLSRGKRLLQCSIRLRAINLSPRPYIGGTFMHLAALIFSINISYPIPGRSKSDQFWFNSDQLALNWITNKHICHSWDRKIEWPID